MQIFSAELQVVLCKTKMQYFTDHQRLDIVQISHPNHLGATELHNFSQFLFWLSQASIAIIGVPTCIWLHNQTALTSNQKPYL